MKPEIRKHYRRIARMGGHARADKLSPERRSEIAAMGGRAKARKAKRGA